MINPVFLHDDGSLSSPYCECGKNLVRQALMRNVVFLNITEGCSTWGCTCSNESRIQRRANAEETNRFYNDMAILADQYLYEIQNDL